MLLSLHTNKYEPNWIIIVVVAGISIIIIIHWTYTWMTETQNTNKLDLNSRMIIVCQLMHHWHVFWARCIHSKQMSLQSMLICAPMYAEIFKNYLCLLFFQSKQCAHFWYVPSTHTHPIYSLILTCVCVCSQNLRVQTTELFITQLFPGFCDSPSFRFKKFPQHPFLRCNQSVFFYLSQNEFHTHKNHGKISFFVF